MAPVDLASLPLEPLQAWFAEQGDKPFRGRQLFRWLHGRCVADYAQMTDLAKPLRARLAATAPLRPPVVAEEQRAADGTRKLRYALADGRSVEGVWMPEQRRRSLCVSTQVGCAMGCAFCATAKMGLVRNLSAGEIAGQVEAAVRHLRTAQLERPVTNVVFMGMGEPLANLRAVVDAVAILLCDHGLGMSRRHVTVSTIGLVPAMRRFVERCPAKLAVSLNAPDDALRDRLMPINRRYPIARLLDACRALPLRGSDRITFEYVMLGGINDRPADARQLVRRLGGLRCKVNLIPYNPHPEAPFDRPAPERVEAFLELLAAKGLSAFVRRSRGAELHAACGQLVVAGSGERA